MAETKQSQTQSTLEREYVIPLRREWSKVPRYKRTRRSVIAIKKFVAKHMKVENRDLNKVKLDMYLNNELWFRGSKKPPARVKVKAKKEGDIVKVDFVEVPEHVKFLKIKREKSHRKADVRPAKTEAKKEDLESKTAEQKKEEEGKREDEKEKAKATEAAMEKAADKAAKVQKHTVQGEKAPKAFRKALKK